MGTDYTTDHFGDRVDSAGESEQGWDHGVVGVLWIRLEGDLTAAP